jgi:hypothetical protein
MMTPARPTDICCAKTSVERDYLLMPGIFLTVQGRGVSFEIKTSFSDGYLPLTAAGFAQDHLRRHARARRARAEGRYA